MIKFGTSGWRGIIADDFTFDNVRLVTQAIAEYLKQINEASKGVIVGYDTRFLSEKFAELSCEVLAGNGIKSLLCKRDTPTPVIALEIIRRKSAGGINFTASHNPFNYNGLKFSPSWGGPALPETTEAIEKFCSEIKHSSIKRIDFSKAKESGIIEYIDPSAAYFRKMKELVDFGAIKKGAPRIALDLLNGTGRGFLDKLFEDAGRKCQVTRDFRDVLFHPGGAPEPNKDNLAGLYGVMKKNSCKLGLSTDGDADRFGVIDSDGTFFSPNEIISVLLYHLIKTRSWSGVVARSVMTTHLIDRIADKFGLEIKETPVGFKYIGKIMIEEKERFVIGGEESGGLTIRGHVPEKDGILACLLVAEAVAISKKSVKELLLEIFKLVGKAHSKRVNFRLLPNEAENLNKKLSKEFPKELGGLKIKKVVTLDGHKFVFEDGSWLGLRLSGTEPVARLYIESGTVSKLKTLEQIGEKFIKS